MSDVFEAASYGDVEKVIERLREGFDVRQTLDSFGRTLLHNAAIRGQKTIVKLLVQLDNELIFQADQMNKSLPLHLAALHGESECLEDLFSTELLVGERKPLLFDKLGNTPLHLAASKGHLLTLETLYLLEFDLNERNCLNGQSALIVAAISGRTEAAAFLIERMADLFVTDNMGYLATHHAAANNHPEMLSSLIKNGMSANATTSDNKTFIHIAAMNKCVGLLHNLLSKQRSVAVIDKTDDSGNTALHLAALLGSAECFNCLFRMNADATIRNNLDETAFDCAKRGGHPVLIGKAAKNEINCELCHKMEKREIWERDNPVPGIVDRITTERLRAFDSAAFSHAAKVGRPVKLSTTSAKGRSLTKDGREPTRINEFKRSDTRDIHSRYCGRNPIDANVQITTLQLLKRL